MSLGIKIPKDALNKGREAFKKGDDYNNVELEPGRYLAQVQKGRGVDTKNGPNIVFDLKIVGESDKAGGKIGIFFSLNEDRAVWLFRALSTFGYEIPDEVNEAFLEEVLADIEATKPVVRIKASRNGDNINYRIEKLVTDVTVNEGGSESAVDTDAGAVTAGRDKEVVKPAATAAKPLPPPPVEETAPAEEAVEEAVEEENVELTVGSKVKANIKGAVVEFTITVLHEAEQKVTGRSAADGKLYKVGLDKLS